MLPSYIKGYTLSGPKSGILKQQREIFYLTDKLLLLFIQYNKND